MYPVFRLLVVTVSVLAACAVVPDESTERDAVVTANRVTTNRVTTNRVTANRVTANRITATRLTANRLTVNPSAAELLATDSGRELFSVLVSCAIPPGITLVATVDGSDLLFFGELGLAPKWLDHPLDLEGQGFVSACVFAKINANSVEVPISIRGPNHALTLDPDERKDFTLEEGAFFGTMFNPPDQPVQWFACRGAGQAIPSGGLLERDCAKEDPENPGLTKCGFFFAGDCAGLKREAACEKFSKHGQFFERCHAQPIDDDHHHGHANGHDDHGRDHVFKEVITTYVIP